jgi:hypothetical protein
MNIKNSNLSWFFFCGLAFFLAVLCLEQGSPARRHFQAFPPPLDRPLPPQLTRFSLMAALGDHSRVASDWAYIDCLQYLGNNDNRDDGHYRQTEALYREVLWLDPGFTHAVLEGASVLGWNQRKVEPAHLYLEDAIRFDPGNDRARLYLVALAYAKADDPVGMIKVLRPELERPDVPEQLLRMVGNVYLKGRDWKGALAYWTWVRGRAQQQETLDMADKSIAQAQAGLNAVRKAP